MEPKVEIVDITTIPRKKRLGGRQERQDINEWLRAIPPKGQALRITLKTKKECGSLRYSLQYRRKSGKISPGIHWTGRDMDMFIWQEEV